MSITSREMRALESNSEYYGVSRLQLMENAGKNIADEIANRFKPVKAKVAVFCGLGGNGGDGFVAARHLIGLGFKVEILLAGKASEISDLAAQKNWSALRFLKDCLEVHEVYDSSLIPHFEAEVAVDALLGIGLKGAPRSPILQLVNKINKMKTFCVAVDVPTGLDSDTGKVLGDAVKADLTITFHRSKPGLAEAKEYTGEVIVKDIGLPPQFEGFTGPGDVQLVTKPRLPDAHKGDFGVLLVIGGSDVYAGAPFFTASAALSAGVDIAYLAAPSKTAYAISSMSPNLITIKLDGDHLNVRSIPTLRPYLERCTAVAMGPGLGPHRETKEAVKELFKIVVEKKLPLLLDADGIRAFAEFKRKAKSPMVITPHGGEFQALTGKSPDLNLNKRVEQVREIAHELNATVLLKGPTDVISNGERVKFDFAGNPSMTVGGTGDVLSGIVAAFLAQGADPFEAAAAGAFINGAAGDFVVNEKGYHLFASDLLDWIPCVMDDPMSHVKVRRTL